MRDTKNGKETVESLGEIFAAARGRRGLELEMVAKETRIRIQQLRDIENNDLSRFAHPSYARMFLTDYARYLDLPLAEIRHLLPDRGECGGEGYQYLGGQGCDVATVPSHRVTPRRRLLPTLATAAAFLVLAGVGFQLWRLKGNIDRLGLGSARVAATTTAVESAASIVVPVIPDAVNDPEFFEASIEPIRPDPAAEPTIPPADQVSLVVGKPLDGGRME